MKTLLIAAAAATLTLTALPAATQDAPAPPPVADSGTPPNVLSFSNSPYRLADTDTHPGRCFDGKTLTGVNRAGDRILYVQARTGEVYGMALADGCEALNTAEKLSVRAGGRLVCEGDRAVVAVTTPAGAKQCRVGDIRRLTRTEVATLAATARR